MESDTDISLVAAVSKNMVIGNNGSIPWNLPEDQQHYRETTMGEPMIMGRKTFESFPRPLPGREHIVLSTTVEQYDYESVFAADSVQNALSLAEEYASENIYVVGGEGVYKSYLPLADEMILSRIPDRYSGDTWFPTWDEAQWQVRERDKRDDFEIVYYVRVSSD